MALFGNKNPMWKGGRINSRGYIRVLLPDHPLCDAQGYILEHRLIAEKEWGLESIEGKVVHHINGDRTDNRIENLSIMSTEQHTSIHHKQEDSDTRIIGSPNPVIFCECGCKGRYFKYDDRGRPRKYINGHNRSLIYVR